MAPLLKVAALALAAAVVVFAVYEVYSLEQQEAPFTGTVPSSFTMNGRTYNFTYTATTPGGWASGLMNKKITNTTIMLFAFSTTRAWTFWMYDTNASLDIIWLKATGDSARVVYLVAGAPPCYDANACARYTPSSGANYAIEAAAGFASANGVAAGTAVEFG